ncbi:MAG: TRAP transporter large permease subunit [Cellvibrionales bacterium]|nr:TRAP transporter large permease subunit [Cellvibrionales bacterium]
MIAFILFIAVCFCLLIGFPVAFSLAGVSLGFAALGVAFGAFDAGFILSMPERLFGIMNNSLLTAVPLFVLMGVFLEQSKIAEKMLTQMAVLLRRLPGGLALSVVLVGALLAASTGIVGATVVTMGLIALPAMIKNHYPAALATGTVSATGTLGQIIPPSIALVLLADTLSTANNEAQLALGNFSPDTLSVGELFVAAIIPGLLLVVLYSFYILFKTRKLKTHIVDAPFDLRSFLIGFIPPLVLILVVLGSIILGLATPAEAAGVGAFGAFCLALLQNMGFKQLQDCLLNATKVTSMVFMILIGAACFSLVFRGFGGDELVQSFFHQLPGGQMSALFVVMVLIFLLGFILDFIEITFVVVPIIGPALIMIGIDPVWLGILIAINLQTSFLTPPFGFALFYLRGVADSSISTKTIYQGVIPFIAIQLLVLLAIIIFPSLATWLPNVLLL